MSQTSFVHRFELRQGSFSAQDWYRSTNLENIGADTSLPIKRSCLACSCTVRLDIYLSERILELKAILLLAPRHCCITSLAEARTATCIHCLLASSLPENDVNQLKLWAVHALHLGRPACGSAITQVVSFAPGEVTIDQILLSIRFVHSKITFRVPTAIRMDMQGGVLDVHWKNVLLFGWTLKDK